MGSIDEVLDRIFRKINGPWQKGTGIDNSPYSALPGRNPNDPIDQFARDTVGKSLGRIGLNPFYRREAIAMSPEVRAIRDPKETMPWANPPPMASTHSTGQPPYNPMGSAINEPQRGGRPPFGSPRREAISINDSALSPLARTMRDPKDQAPAAIPRAPQYGQPSIYPRYYPGMEGEDIQPMQRLMPGGGMSPVEFSERFGQYKTAGWTGDQAPYGAISRSRGDSEYRTNLHPVVYQPTPSGYFQELKFDPTQNTYLPTGNMTDQNGMTIQRAGMPMQTEGPRAGETAIPNALAVLPEGAFPQTFENRARWTQGGWGAIPEAGQTIGINRGGEQGQISFGVPGKQPGEEITTEQALESRPGLRAETEMKIKNEKAKGEEDYRREELKEKGATERQGMSDKAAMERNRESLANALTVAKQHGIDARKLAQLNEKFKTEIKKKSDSQLATEVLEKVGKNFMDPITGQYDQKGATEFALKWVQIMRMLESGGQGQAEKPPVEGAKKGKDGKWYLPDPKRPGKYMLLEERAMGGEVEEDQPYMVGEQGPEVFVPKRSGGIIPNPSTTMINGLTPVSADWVNNMATGLAGAGIVDYPRSQANQGPGDNYRINMDMRTMMGPQGRGARQTAIPESPYGPSIFKALMENTIPKRGVW